jgi:hypothetical protein
MKAFAVATLIALFSTTVFAQQQKVSPDSVFAKYFQATGGKAQWDQVKSYRLNRKYTSTNVASFDAEISGSLAQKSLYKNEIIKGRGFGYGISATDSWRKVPLGSSDKVTKYQVSNLSTDKQAELKLDLYDLLVPFLDYQERGFIATVIGPDTYKGKSVQKVELQSKAGRYTLLFDEATGLLTQSKLLAGGEETIRDFDAYVKSAFGILYPSKIQQTEVKRKATYSITSELTVNPTVDPALFKR